MKRIANFNELITGSHLFLKRYKISDKNLISQLTKVSRENHDYIFEFTEWENKLLSEKDIFNYINKVNDLWNKKNRATYAIITKDTHEFIGDVSLFNIDFKNSSGELGIWCSKKFKGQGYASEAINLILNSFSKKGITLFKARTDVRNEASNNLMKRNNFKEFNTLMALFTNVYYKSMKSR